MTAIPERKRVVEQMVSAGQPTLVGESDPIDGDFTVRYLQRQTN
jgi:hypothetical protein